MSKAFYPTQDGHVGNLKKILLPQLLEMIQRQENLLKRKAFLNNLADKGEKITQHLQVLYKELESRHQESNSAETKHVNHVNRQNPIIPVSVFDQSTSVKDSEKDDLKTHQLNTNNLKNVDVDAVSLEKGFENLNVQDTEAGYKAKNKHQYEIAVERAEQHSKEQTKEYQRLNRALHITKVEDLPTEMRYMKSDEKHEKVQKKILLDEESAAVPPKYRYDTSKVISLDESLQLQQTQKQKQEELQAQLAAEKLAQRLNIKLETYNPEGIDMSYRDGKTGENFDSDDDDECEGLTTHDGADMADILTSDTED